MMGIFTFLIIKARSFSRCRKDIFEEIDAIKKDDNCGWNIKESGHCLILLTISSLQVVALPLVRKIIR